MTLLELRSQITEKAFTQVVAAKDDAHLGDIVVCRARGPFYDSFPWLSIPTRYVIKDSFLRVIGPYAPAKGRTTLGVYVKGEDINIPPLPDWEERKTYPTIDDLDTRDIYVDEFGINIKVEEDLFKKE